MIDRLIAEGADMFQKDVGGNAPADLVPSRQLLLHMKAALKRRREAQEAKKLLQTAATTTTTTTTTKNSRNQTAARPASGGGGGSGVDEHEYHYNAREKVKNLREPSLRLVDYVAVLAFDPDTKESTVRTVR